MGFAEQLTEILGRLAEGRQTLLFSATLPSKLVEFARAGLTQPALIRLDTDVTISEHLRNVFFSVRAEEKAASLLWMMKNLIPQKQVRATSPPPRIMSTHIYIAPSISAIANHSWWWRFMNRVRWCSWRRDITWSTCRSCCG